MPSFVSDDVNMVHLMPHVKAIKAVMSKKFGRRLLRPILSCVIHPVGAQALAGKGG
jgi:hypothetical protein